MQSYIFLVFRNVFIKGLLDCLFVCDLKKKQHDNDNVTINF